MAARLVYGDALEILKSMPIASVDVCVTDPPYGLKFMSKSWDHGVPGEPYWRAVSRVLKSGSFLLAFGGTRTHHRLMCSIEDAGFEIRDCLMWLHGQGFPKGKGQLKPAWEPIVLARKPGVSPWLNVDKCRIEGTAGKPASIRDNRHFDERGEAYSLTVAPDPHPAGRWPANVMLSHDDDCTEVRPVAERTGDPYIEGRGHPLRIKEIGGCTSTCAVRLLDEQSGVLRSGGKASSTYRQQQMGTYTPGPNQESAFFGSAGGASRFYYCPKASRSERGSENDWPTVKPLALMRWLVRLVTPKGGIVLDPFCGSGTTLLAAECEYLGSIGIDSDPHALSIARKRLGISRKQASVKKVR